MKNFRKSEGGMSSGGGFTLVELLVTVAIILVLAGLVFVVASKAISSANSAANMAQLRNIAPVMQSYAAEFRHYPPAYDNNYASRGLGVRPMEWQDSMNRFPDILNSYMERTANNDFFISPTSGATDSTIVGGGGNMQATNYTGHPGLISHTSDRSALSVLGIFPLPPTIVRRPSETFLLTDGVPRNESGSMNCQTSVRTWAQDGSVVNQRERTQDRPLDLKPQGNGGGDFSGIAFRNNGKAHVLFVDGHIEAFLPADFKVKHVSLGF